MTNIHDLLNTSISDADSFNSAFVFDVEAHPPILSAVRTYTVRVCVYSAAAIWARADFQRFLYRMKKNIRVIRCEHVKEATINRRKKPNVHCVMYDICVRDEGYSNEIRNQCVFK